MSICPWKLSAQIRCEKFFYMNLSLRGKYPQGFKKVYKMKIMITQNTFIIAAIFYFLSFILLTAGKENNRFVQAFFLAGLFANFLSIGARYYFSWPLLPLYSNSYFLPFFIGIVFLISGRTSGPGNQKNEIFIVYFIIALLAVAAVFFPKDYFHPFIKSNSLFSQLFFLLGIIGKAFFIIAALYSFFFLKHKSNKHFTRMRSYIIWGYAFWTLSLFSGEIWAYIGWGSPVVWDDASFTTVMALWFYYGCFLHLHLLKSWNRQRIAGFALAGFPVILFINFYTEMGRFCLPKIL